MFDDSPFRGLPQSRLAFLGNYIGRTAALWLLAIMWCRDEASVRRLVCSSCMTLRTSLRKSI